MKDKTILGAWCSEPNCIFIDHKHIETKVMVHIWYSYDGDSKTDVLNKEISFVKEIDFDDFNNIVEIPNENKIPEKLDYFKSEEELYNMSKIILFNNFVDKINGIIDCLKSKGE